MRIRPPTGRNVAAAYSIFAAANASGERLTSSVSARFSLLSAFAASSCFAPPHAAKTSASETIRRERQKDKATGRRGDRATGRLGDGGAERQRDDCRSIPPSP